MSKEGVNLLHIVMAVNGHGRAARVNSVCGRYAIRYIPARNSILYGRQL
jgi:hypothetical protein